MKSNRKIPYGAPVIITAIILGLSVFALSDRINPNYGPIESKGGTAALIIIGGMLLVAAVVFLVNSILIEKDLKGPEAEREQAIKDRPDNHNY